MTALDDPDNLIPFFQLVASNQQASIRNFPDQYALLRRVNICLSEACKNLINPEPIMCALLFARCQYAYKAAAGMALSGQVVEAFVMARSCLEYAGYALIIFADPSLENVWTNRHVSDADMQAQKRAFRAGEIYKIVKSFDPTLANVFSALYERTIDFGGHPNPHGTFSAMKIGEDNSIATFALVTDQYTLQHAMKSVAQIGLAALFIFRHIFEDKFELVGVSDEMNRLRECL
jgi:hypothetical protein